MLHNHYYLYKHHVISLMAIITFISPMVYTLTMQETKKSNKEIDAMIGNEDTA